MELDEVADELYEVPPDEFIALRTSRRDEAKAEGDKALAKDIGALPKPSAAAWVCNLLVRAHRSEVEGLIELGDLLREAQENLAGDQLKALDTQRRRLIAALTQQARSLAYERGSSVSSSVATQVEETLRAAMADPEAGQALLTGRLTSPMTYNGLGTTVGRPDLRLVRSPTAEPAAREKPPAAKPERPAAKTATTSAEDRRRAREEAAEEKRRAEQERRRRELEEARQAADEATALAEEALAAADEQRRAVDEVRARHDELSARVDDLADQLAEAERAAAESATELKRTERRRATAEREAADAESARDTAVARAERLEEDSEG